ncbi:ArsR/SmtB family transcription factor [Catenuloplanes japonicus]|uniref:ArsR/SmtB family transcription factor n=1 Tax=Catenuloplanes japonicus TaxID=33876 RepID=UPI0038BA7E6A
MANELAPLFKALGDPVRLRLLSLIASAPEVCVCDLTDAFELTGATISHHLRVLRESGMVEVERRGTWAYYRARTGALTVLGNVLGSEPAPAEGGSASSCGTAPTTPAASENQEPLISANPDLIRLMADPLRSRIVRILAAGPATTSQLVTDTGAKQPNVSGHLKLLREAGAVVTEPRGRFTYYRLVPGALQSAAMHLVDLAAEARTNADNVRNCC